MIEIPFNKKYTQFQDRNVLLFTGIATPETEKIPIFSNNAPPTGFALYLSRRAVHPVDSEQRQISGTAPSQQVTVFQYRQHINLALNPGHSLNTGGIHLHDPAIPQSGIEYIVTGRQ